MSPDGDGIVYDSRLINSLTVLLSARLYQRQGGLHHLSHIPDAGCSAFFDRSFNDGLELFRDISGQIGFKIAISCLSLSARSGRAPFHIARWSPGAA